MRRAAEVGPTIEEWRVFINNLHHHQYPFHAYNDSHVQVYFSRPQLALETFNLFFSQTISTDDHLN